MKTIKLKLPWEIDERTIHLVLKGKFFLSPGWYSRSETGYLMIKAIAETAAELGMPSVDVAIPVPTGEKATMSNMENTHYFRLGYCEAHLRKFGLTEELRELVVNVWSDFMTEAVLGDL